MAVLGRANHCPSPLSKTVFFHISNRLTLVYWRLVSTLYYLITFILIQNICFIKQLKSGSVS